MRKAFITATFLTIGTLFQPGCVLASPTKFYLQCAGTVEDQVKGISRPWSDLLKIDLDKKQYCAGPGCLSNPVRLKLIQKVLTDRIILEDQAVQNNALGQVVIRFIINRSNNSVEFYTAYPSVNLISKGKGTCTIGQFTGF